MQLKHKKIAGLLSIATATLITTPAQAEENKWDVDSALLIYAETDRVSAVEPVVSMSKDLGDDEILSIKLTLDGLTGASASGAVPSANVQTFTRPSGKGTFDVKANETPLDDTFQDGRVAFNLNWDKPVDRNNRRSLGFNISKEYDFFSLGGNFLWQHEINQKNTALSAGISIELDDISPVGNTPLGLSNVANRSRVSSSESKEIVDLVFGVTQVIDQTSLFQLNLSLSNASGYMNDPYKIVSIVDAGGESSSFIYEKRMDTRSRQSLYGKYKKTLSNKDVLTASYRLMSDDWGVDSHTFDMTYKYKLEDGFYLQPHFRLYQQSAADFYRYFLVEGDALPDYVSADYRLGEMTATTFGLKVGKEINQQHFWSARIEMYQQSGESSPSEAIGQLKNQDLFPDVNAIIMQVNYSFKW